MPITDEAFDPEMAAPVHGSVWNASREATAFSALDSDLSVDVVIVGGGICGVTAASELARNGRSVALLEAGAIGMGTTGHSTGNLYATVDESLHALGAKWGAETAAEVARSRLRAIERIEANIAEHRIKCGFSRQPWVLYSIDGSAEETEQIEAEYEAALRAGLDARLALDLPLPYMVRKAMVMPNQAQFDPFAYARQLAQRIRSPQCRLFEASPVIAIDEENGIVRTERHAVRADHVVIATHTPKGFSLLQTELGVYREHAVAAPLNGHALAGGIFWARGAYPTSTRLAMIEGKPYVLLIGEKHKTGDVAASDAAYARLEDTLRARFDIGAIGWRWSAQQYRAADGLPYIGSTETFSNLYVATGFGSDGLTYGTLAGMLIAAEIEGEAAEHAALYSPRRFTPVKSARNFLRENLDVAGHYIRDYAQSIPSTNPIHLARGEGGLVEHEGERLAAYRDEEGKLHLLSPVCTHLKCLVHWNRAEKSWDCPCHGSRFNHEGAVIEGPALQPLERRGGSD